MFKVYNGPMEVIKIRMLTGTVTLRLPPRCGECDARIADRMSDRLCSYHAVEYVTKWDKENAAEIRDDEHR
jgi:hypothetical protein